MSWSPSGTIQLHYLKYSSQSNEPPLAENLKKKKKKFSYPTTTMQICFPQNYSPICSCCVSLSHKTKDLNPFNQCAKQQIMQWCLKPNKMSPRSVDCLLYVTKSNAYQAYFLHPRCCGVILRVPSRLRIALSWLCGTGWWAILLRRGVSESVCNEEAVCCCSEQLCTFMDTVLVWRVPFIRTD